MLLEQDTEEVRSIHLPPSTFSVKYEERRAQRPYTIKEPRIRSLAAHFGGIFLGVLVVLAALVLVLLQAYHQTAGLLSFWGSVFGGTISGVGTLAGVVVTLDWRRHSEAQRTYRRLTQHFSAYLSAFEAADAFLYAVLMGPYLDTDLEEIVDLSRIVDPSPFVQTMRRQYASLVPESRALTLALNAFGDQIEAVWPTLFPRNAARRFPDIEPERRRTIVAAELGLLSEIIVINRELQSI